MRIYKKYRLICSINLIIILLFFGTIIYFISHKYNIYTKVVGNYINNKEFSIIVDNKDFNTLLKRKYFYINSKKEKIKLIDINKGIYTLENKNYNEVILEGNFNKKEDIIISIFRKKANYLTMFIDCWKEKS